MPFTPKVALRDGSGYSESVTFSTNASTGIFLEGVADPLTADIQVSVNGSPFTSSSLLVKFDLPAFTVPNPNATPDGLSLELGENVFLIRTIDIVGAVSSPATVSISRVRESEIVAPDAPTGVEVRRHRDVVDIRVKAPDALTGSFGGPSSSEFRGFNFYASTTPSGATGYFRVNKTPVTVISEEEQVTAYRVGTESTTWVNSNPNIPSNLRTRVSVEDDFGNELETRLDTSTSLLTYPNTLKFSSQLEELEVRKFVRFTHNRKGGANIVNEDLLEGVNPTDLLYYVVTATFFDAGTGQELESPFSQEVSGSPLTIDTNVRDLPAPTEADIRTRYLQKVLSAETGASLIPGSTTRDVSIDPFSSEARRIYLILDFIARSQSLLTLLQIDDADGDGVSDLVSQSAYKTALKSALGLASDEAVQTLIDGAFDKIASNNQKSRLPGYPATGQAVCYITARPAFDLPIPAGTIVSTVDSPVVRYRVGGTYVMIAAFADSYYNFNTKRYEIVVDITAESIGEEGNRSAGDIKSIEGVSGFQVINTESTQNGKSRESNADLAERTLLSFTAVDTGTEGGYQSRAAAQPGVVKSKVVKAGDPLMMRDYDPVRRKHIGGKVDVWIQGGRERQVTEKFAFTFEIAKDIRVQVVDRANLIFRVLDSRVTESTPVIEILDNFTQGLGVRNITQGLDYLVTGVTILDYQTFKLNPLLSGQPVTNLDDLVSVDYRFRAVNKLYLSLQPVRRVVSVVGDISGPLDTSLGYTLSKTEDPLLEGESTIAKDYLSIQQVGGVPSGVTTQINDEQHILVGFQPDPLNHIGINTKTLRVFSSDRLIEFAGPDALDPDYDLVGGSPTTPISIVRTQDSTIVDGLTVSVDYVHDENFAVTYVVNDVLQEMQRTYNVNRHVTGDVLVKQAVQNSIELEATVILKKGATKLKTDPLVRTSVSNDLNSRAVGKGVGQSDVIKDVDSTSGVDRLLVPMARMAYADGSRKLREPVASSYQSIPSLNLVGNLVFLLTSPLKSPTTAGGGLSTEHKGVFQDDEAMDLAARFDLVGQSASGAYILGATGESISGFTDSVTLASQGFTTLQAQQAERVRLTANRVLVSIPYTTDPSKHSYAASYVIRGDVGAKDIEASAVEYLDLGRFTVTYKESN